MNPRNYMRTKLGIGQTEEFLFVGARNGHRILPAQGAPRKRRRQVRGRLQAEAREIGRPGQAHVRSRLRDDERWRNQLAPNPQTKRGRKGAQCETKIFEFAVHDHLDAQTIDVGG